ncbi:hypothetical protein PCANC_09515 [Puccinia coronata f. sp. avenae]|uniref:Uncharacterized protein n=1 Tax=Puccinia coronata f. sp. avenae TaxID=200324 RepID=A0A2N5V4Z3_9BASI|nr:hypothetical protein PCASD_17658 [Puccinia coronata f. sp. avenae]PLW45068.1 hypothetical protein PCANC_09515 [Puccinia coronata f. sp. avenae]
MRSTLDKALLSIVESNEISSSKELFELLQSKCKRSGRRHKVILTKKILKFASKKAPASESWLARFCAIMLDIERAKISVNKLGGLILQALAKAPPGTDSKNFEYSISHTCVTQILRLQANDKSGFIIGLDPIPAQG